MAASDRRAYELAAIGALLAYERLARDVEPGMTPAHVYGWVPKPAPDGWTVRTARLACERLEARGHLTAVAGDRFHPRRYLLGEDFASACPADGCPGLEWHRQGGQGAPRPCGCGHPTKTSDCEGLRTPAYLAWKDAADA